MDKAKPFEISKREVWEAYKQVKANRGAAGVDGESLTQFEQDLRNNLYRLWNRMSSGSYMPKPVRRVYIPKGDGRMRPLGIPTVADRIAQMVAKRFLEPILDPLFHGDSYGYRPGRSAHQALAKARKRCWSYDWVLDLDIKGFFDNIDHTLLMRAVRKHTDCRWVLLYIERWLNAPVQMPDGTEAISQGRGTPQGGVISPLLANLFLHYAFDLWMHREYPGIPFERYADDVICHCSTEAQAQSLRQSLQRRLAECKLELHPEKTKVVYCRDVNRRGDFPVYKFDFLGFEFRPRESKNRFTGKLFVAFTPAISPKAAKALRLEIRRWRLHLRTDLSFPALMDWIRPIVFGWCQYYGHFHQSALVPALRTLNHYLMRWAIRKFRSLRGSPERGWEWLMGIQSQHPDLLPIWGIAEVG
jgi:group II intron reverse transcriptase/maturase